MAWEIAVLVLSDIMVYGTLPIHLRFLYVLLTKRNTDLDPSYHILLTNLSIYNVLFGLSYAFIQEPAAHGLAPDFYAGNAQWLGRIELVKATALIFCQCFHTLIGLNRLTAFAFPLRQKEIWSPRHAWIVCGGVWIVVVGLAMPIVILPSTQYIMKVNFFERNSVEYLFMNSFRVITMISTGVFEAANLFNYAGILLVMKRYKTVQGNYDKFTRNIKRMTFAAAVNSSGELLAQ